MSYANPHYDPDWQTLHDRHDAERKRAEEAMQRLAENGAMLSDTYESAKAEFDRNHAACLATFKMQHATVQEYAEWVFRTFRVDMEDWVLGVNSSHHYRSWQRKPPVAGTAEEIAGAIDPSRWQRLSAGDGTKGARLHDWVYCELADLDAGEYVEVLT